MSVYYRVRIVSGSHLCTIGLEAMLMAVVDVANTSLCSQWYRISEDKRTSLLLSLWKVITNIPVSAAMHNVHIVSGYY